MGMLYRRKKRDSQTGQMIESKVWWMKYYDQDRPIRESAQTTDKTAAARKLKEREYQLSIGIRQGAQADRTMFEDLVAGIRTDYAVNKRKSSRRLNDFIVHLSTSFTRMKAASITTERIKAYVAKRQTQGAANGTINRKLGCLKRMFHLAYQETPPRVLRVPYIPMLEEHNIRSGFFEHEEFLSLRGVLPDYCQVAVTLAYYSGMRMGEVFSLDWKQVDLIQGKLFLRSQDTKTDSPKGSLPYGRPVTSSYVVETTL